MVIADNCAEYVNIIFQQPEDYSGSSLLLASVLFAFQIYGDFSGYSDIAIGISKLFGFQLMQNFAFPYFSKDIAEFWRRWHISLSTWFRDYLYIPLGGSQGGKAMKIRNTLIIFVVSGFWHGANWTFIVWGLLNAIYFLPLLLFDRNRNNIDIVAKGRILPSLKELFNVLLTFLLTCIAWIFFRADNLTDALNYIYHMVSPSVVSIPYFENLGWLLMMVVIIGFFLLVEWLGRESKFAIEHTFSGFHRVVRWLFYSFIIFLIAMYAETNETPFIYFQF